MEKLSRILFCSTLVFLLFLSSCTSTTTVVDKKGPADLISEGVVFSHGGNFEKAIEMFKSVLNEYPLSEYVLEAQILLADTYYSMKEYSDSASYYTDFVVLHPAHPKAPYAQFRKGMSYFKEILSSDRDQSATKKAILAFDDLIANYPSSIYVDRAIEMRYFLRNRLADNELYVGKFYFKNGKYQGALKRFEAIIGEFPDSGVFGETLYYLGESYLALGEDELAGYVFERLVNSFPESPFADGAKLHLNGG